VTFAAYATKLVGELFPKLPTEFGVAEGHRARRGARDAGPR
jgi:hypothetical protein